MNPDPCRFEVALHADGRVVIWNGAVGQHMKTDGPCVVVVATAAPGGSGLLDAEGRHALSSTDAAYYEIEIRRIK